MAKFCNNCGTQLEDDAVFCASCGTAQEAAPEAAPAADFAPQYEAPAAPEAPAAKKNFLPVIIGGVAAVVVVVLLIVLLGGSGGYKKVLKYQGQVEVGNFKNVKALAPQEYWDCLEDEEDMDYDDFVENLEENYDKYTADALEDEYGDNLKVKFNVEKKKNLKDKKVEKIAEALEEQYDIDEKKVKKAIEVKGEATIKGSDDDDDADFEQTFVKIGSKWYPIRYQDNGDSYSVSFVFGLF